MISKSFYYGDQNFWTFLELFAGIRISGRLLELFAGIRISGRLLELFAGIRISGRFWSSICRHLNF